MLESFPWVRSQGLRRQRFPVEVSQNDLQSIPFQLVSTDENVDQHGLVTWMMKPWETHPFFLVMNWANIRYPNNVRSWISMDFMDFTEP